MVVVFVRKIFRFRVARARRTDACIIQVTKIAFQNTDPIACYGNNTNAYFEISIEEECVCVCALYARTRSLTRDVFHD